MISPLWGSLLQPFNLKEAVEPKETKEDEKQEGLAQRSQFTRRGKLAFIPSSFFSASCVSFGHPAAGFRFNPPPSSFRVRPDFVFPKLRLAVFVDGCFWHGCPQHCNQPANNRAFWRRKLAANKARDRRVNRTLRKAGWRVVRIWEHELARRHETRCLRRIRRLVEAKAEKAEVKCQRSNSPAE